MSYAVTGEDVISPALYYSHDSGVTAYIDEKYCSKTRCAAGVESYFDGLLILKHFR